MKTVLGYSPYAQSGVPKGPLAFATLVLIGIFGLVGVIVGMTGSSEPAPSASQPIAHNDNRAYAMGYESGSSPHGVGVLQRNEGSNVEDACWMAYQIKIISQDMIGERRPFSESDFRQGCQDALEQA